jgi:anti-sigma regulatory factor (Ser/Thr protein kinase)
VACSDDQAAPSTSRRSRSRIFPATTNTVPAARHWANQVLAGWGLSASDAELALNELVTNAVLHGAGDVQAVLTDLGFGVRLVVHDHGGRGPIVHQSARHSQPGGRGLDIISHVSTTWGWNQPEAGGTIVWAVVPTMPLAYE